MAVVDLAAERGERTREDLALVDEVAQDVVLVDEGDVDVEELQDALQLLQRELARRQLDLALEELRLEVFGRLLLHPGLALGPARHGRGVDEGHAHLEEVAVDHEPLLLRQVAQREREEDAVFLEDHLADARAERLDAALVERIALAVLLERLRDDAELALDLIVDAPHDLRGARDAVVVEHRHQELLFLGVVRAHGIEPCDEARELRDIARADHLVVDGIEVADERVILEAQQAKRMALGQVIRRQKGGCGSGGVRLLRRLAQRFLLLALALRAVMEQRGMDVAEALDILERHAALDEVLLRLGNLLGLDVLEMAHEVGAHRLERFAAVEARDVLAQHGLARLLLRTRQSEALRLERCADLLHRDAFDDGAARQRHDAAHELQGRRLHDVLEAEFCQYLLEFRVFADELRHAFLEVQFFHRHCSLCGMFLSDRLLPSIFYLLYVYLLSAFDETSIVQRAHLCRTICYMDLSHGCDAHDST